MIYAVAAGSFFAVMALALLYHIGTRLDEMVKILRNRE